MLKDDQYSWDRWRNLSDVEQVSLMQAEARRYRAWLDSLTPSDLYAFRRQKALQACLRWRKMIAEDPSQRWKDQLRYYQRHLLQMRVPHT